VKQSRASVLSGACFALIAGLVSAWNPPASADEFFQGKTLELVVPTGAGGSFDTLTRLIGRYIGRHLPGGPIVVVKNRPGGGGFAAANYLYNRAPQDGTSIGMLEQSIYEAQLFKTEGLLADARRFNWLGRVMSNNAVLFAWHTAAVKKIEDAFNAELIVAASGSSSLMRWTALKRLTGIKLKIIVGHQGTAEAALAMERGEVDALSAPWVVFRVAHADWLRDKKVNVLLQTGLERAADLPDVPRFVDLAKDDEQRQLLELFSQSDRVGRSLVAPPNVPQDRIETLRSAFAATLDDPDFFAETKTLQLALDPLPGAAMQAIILKSFDYSPSLVAKAEALASRNNE
jgi:tripartite-type tricarboxylate transporter receptor subunit TctC